MDRNYLTELVKKINTSEYFSSTSHPNTVVVYSKFKISHPIKIVIFTKVYEIESSELGSIIMFPKIINICWIKL